MRMISFTLAAAAALWSAACNPPPQAVVYSHGSGFRLSVPAGWTKVTDNDRLFIFCCDNRRLIEAGGYRHPLAPSELKKLSDAAADSLLDRFIREQLDVFMAENDIRETKVLDEGKTWWAGHPSYQLRVDGYSSALKGPVAMDFHMLLHKENATIYFLDIMMPAPDYVSQEAVIRNVVGSYEIMD